MSYKDDIGKLVMARFKDSMIMTNAWLIGYDEYTGKYEFRCGKHDRTFHADSYILPDDVKQ